MKLSSLVNSLEEFAPNVLQESYDNAGLIYGKLTDEVSKALICIDVTPEIIEEAKQHKCDIIIAHHPLIFRPIKKLNGSNMVETVLIDCIKSNIRLYAMHTNLDNLPYGVNAKLAEVLNIINTKILSPGGSKLNKLVTFCPIDHAEKVRSAIFEAGAGHIGNYDSCSFNTDGKGSFRALENSNPFVGEKGKIHFENEIRIETIVPDFLLLKVLHSMMAAHPYEEVAYDIYPLENKSEITGAGMIGELKEEMEITQFLEFVKQKLKAKTLKHNKLISQKVKKVAICGGSGAFLINRAARAKADVFISADIKYHDYFEHLGDMTIVDAGHYETEQYTKDLIHTFLTEKFPTFAVRKSETDTNPVSYL